MKTTLIAAMLFLAPMAPAQQPAATNGAAGKLPKAPSLAERVAALEKEVADLQKQLAAYAAMAGKPVPPVADSWETQDLNNNHATQKQSHHLPKTAKTLVVEYFQQSHIGGTVLSSPVRPPKQIVLVPAQDSTLVLSPGPAFACSWIFGLSADGNTLNLDASHCSYPTGFRAVFNLTINQ